MDKKETLDGGEKKENGGKGNEEKSIISGGQTKEVTKQRLCDLGFIAFFLSHKLNFSM